MRWLNNPKQAQWSCLNQPLGRGAYGVVYLANYVDQIGREVLCAAKCFTTRDDFSDELYMTWQVAGAPHVIGFHGICNGPDSTSTALVTEYVTPIPRSPPLDTINKLSRQFFEFLIGMKALGVLHRDLKPANCGLSATGDLCVYDFGIAATETELGNALVQSAWYRAPEIFLNCKGRRIDAPYTAAIDMWSVGTIIAEWLQGKSLIWSSDRKTDQEIPYLVARIGMPPTAYLTTTSHAGQFFTADEQGNVTARSPITARHLDQYLAEFPDWLDLLKQILVWNPGERLTPEAALQHRLFQNRSA